METSQFIAHMDHMEEKKEYTVNSSWSFWDKTCTLLVFLDAQCPGDYIWCLFQDDSSILVLAIST